MLQLDPAKRLPLSKVLEHKWMQAGKQQEPHVMNRLRVYNSKDNLVWNDQVLLAIQRMGYNLDSVKQVPHPCMHTCRGRGRRGKQVPHPCMHTFLHHTTIPTLPIHPSSSLHNCSPFPPPTQAVLTKKYDDNAALYFLLLTKWVKGQLQVPSDPLLSYPRMSTSSSQPIPQISVDTSEPSAFKALFNPWHKLAEGDSTQQAPETDDYFKDPNLARYLQQGRRHTLGAAHNHALVPPTVQLKEISEGSGPVSSNEEDDERRELEAMTEIGRIEQSRLNDSIQSSTGSIVSSGAQKPYLQPPRACRSSRRASDGGHYVAAYKVYLERRGNPKLGGCPTTTLDKQDSASGTQLVTTSVKQLLQERMESRQYGTLPQGHHWVHYKLQQSQGLPHQPSSGAQSHMQVTDEPTASLRDQVQPFHDITPYQIQEQLQQLHLQQVTPIDSVPPTLGGVDLVGVVAGETEGLLKQSHSSSSVGSGGGQSRKSSSGGGSPGGSLIAHLLSSSPPVRATTIPQSSSPPSHTLVLQEQALRRYSNPEQSNFQTYSPMTRRSSNPQTFPALSVYANQHHLPSFPVAVAQPRESSPTKMMYHSNNGTSASGKHSPIHETQMDAIVETTEESVLDIGLVGGSGVAMAPPTSLSGGCVPQHKTSPRKVGFPSCAPQLELAALLQANVPSSTPSPYNGKHLITMLSAGTCGTSSPLHSFVTADMCSPESYCGTAWCPPLFARPLPRPSLQPYLTGMLGRVSSILTQWGIPFEVREGGNLTVEHQGVRLQILMAQNAIQMQYLAGDTYQYQTLCSHLASQFQLITI